MNSASATYLNIVVPRTPRLPLAFLARPLVCWLVDREIGSLRQCLELIE